jgi:hypothetical protein
MITMTSATALKCILLWHKYREVRVLEQTLSSGVQMTLDGDVCERCGKLRDAWNAQHVYCLMMALGREPIIAHPSVLK